MPPAKATVRPGVASLVSSNVKEVPRLDTPFGVANVKVQLPFKVAVNTLASLQSMVIALPVLPSATTLSEKVPAKNWLESKNITELAVES